MTAAGLALPAGVRPCGFDRARFTLADMDVMQAIAKLDCRPFYVVYSGHAMGRAAAHLLLRRLRDGSWAQRVVTVPVGPLESCPHHESAGH
jgi:hypothetical protein